MNVLWMTPLSNIEIKKTKQTTIERRKIKPDKEVVNYINDHVANIFCTLGQGQSWSYSTSKLKVLYPNHFFPGLIYDLTE